MKDKKLSILLMGLGGLLLIGACVMVIGNIIHSKQAQEASSLILESLEHEVLATQEAHQEDVQEVAETEQEENLIKVGENVYLGKLEVPALGLVLPINNAWSYPSLKETPSRYKGSIEDDSLIIMAHNYNTHFGNIHLLREKDEVSIIRPNGETVMYEVLTTEVLRAEEVEMMESGEWDLTLFTCSYDGTKRIAVRCKQYNRGEEDERL